MSRLHALFTVAAITAASLASAIIPAANLAYACSGNPGDLIADSPALIRGRITGWRDIAESTTSVYRPIEVTVAVTSVYKGSPPSTFTFVDEVSYTVNGGQAYWAGAAGACGVFDFDPTGAEIIMPVRRDDAGDIRLNRLEVLYLGPPSDRLDQVDALIRSRLGSPIAPAAGTGHDEDQDRQSSSVFAAGLALLAAATALGVPLVARRKHEGAS